MVGGEIKKKIKGAGIGGAAGAQGRGVPRLVSAFSSPPGARGGGWVLPVPLPVACAPPCRASSAPSSLGTGPLQDPQVVLFGYSKFEAAEGVVEAEGGVLGGQGAGEHGHDGVQGSEVRVAAALRVAPGPTGQPLRLLEPLDLGARHGELAEELVGLRAGDALGEIRHLQHPAQDDVPCAQVGGGGLERLSLASVSVL